MALFWGKTPLTPRFAHHPAEDRRAGGQDDRHAAQEQETAPQAGGTRDRPDEGRPGDEPEISQDRHGRERRPAASLAAEPAGQAEERRRREGQPSTRDHEAGKGYRRMLRGGGDREPRRGGEAGKEHAARHRRPVDLLREDTSGHHRAGEETRAEPADRGARVQGPLEKERAPRLHAVLNEEREREDQPDDDQRTFEPRTALTWRRLGVRPTVHERSRGPDHGNPGQDPRRMRARVPQQARADTTYHHTARERGVQAVHDTDLVHRLEPRRVAVDRDVEQPGRDPDQREKDDERADRARDPRQGRDQPEEDEKDRDEPRTAECVGEAARHEHRRQSRKRDAEQRQPELRVARAGSALDCREAGSPRAPEQSEDAVGRGETASPPQSCKYLSTRFCSWSRRRPSRISRARTAPTPVIASRSLCDARTIASRSPRPPTTFLTTPSGMRGMRDKIRKPRGVTEWSCGFTSRGNASSSASRSDSRTCRYGRACNPSSASSARGPAPSTW